MDLDQCVPDRVHGGGGKHREEDEKRHARVIRLAALL